MIRIGLFAGLAVLLLLCPLPLGGNRPWTMAVIQTVIAFLTLLLAAGALRPDEASRRLKDLFWPAVLALPALAWGLYQTLPWIPPSWAHPVWAMAQDALNGPVTPAIAVNPEAARAEWIMLLAMVQVFLISFWVAVKPVFARGLLWTVTIAALFYALYGLGLHFAELEHALYPPTPEAKISTGLTGPFANRNHFAVYLGLGLVAGFALAGEGLRTRSRSGWGMRAGLARFAAVVSGPGALYGTGLLILFTALILTTSRAGTASVLAGLISVGLCFAAKTRGAGRWAVGAGAGLTAILLAVIVAWSGAGLAARLGQLDPELAGRMEAWRAALSMIRDAPFLGTGLGSFADLYPLYAEERYTEAAFVRAHNEYLDLAAGLGLPAALAWLAALAWIGVLCLAGLGRRRHTLAGVTAALGAMTILGLHSLVDFAPEIPAVTLTFAVLLGVGCAQARRTPDRPVKRRTQHAGHGP